MSKKCRMELKYVVVEGCTMVWSIVERAGSVSLVDGVNVRKYIEQ
jgi:hypothetical protein